jgi:hypothetical protein
MMKNVWIEHVVSYISEIRISGTEFPEKGGSVFLLCNATGKKYPPVLTLTVTLYEKKKNTF